MSNVPMAIRFMVVEPDSVFRSGLLSCLSRFADLQVVAETDTTASAWRILAERLAREESLDVIVAGFGLEFCQSLRSQYPDLPILLSEPLSETELLTAFQAGVAGYCPKGSSIVDFVSAIRQVAAGESYWRPEVLERLSLAATTPETISVLAVLRQNWRASGLRQIDAALDDINAQLQYPGLSVLDKVFLTGRRRELKAARWLVQQLLPAQDLRGRTRISPARTSTRLQGRETALPPLQPTSALAPTDSSQIVSESQGEEIRPKALQGILFDRISAKLQSSLENLTTTPLEIDILKPEKKRELFYTILRQLEAGFDELRFSQVQASQLLAKQPVILRDLWQAVVIDFFGRYSTVRIRNRDIEIVSTLLEAEEIVQTEFLDKIPLVQDVFCHLLFQTPLTIDQTPYSADTPEALDRATAILENLTIQLACAVIQPLLNRFSNLETIKQGFYDRRLLSTREIERFRNDLSWRYRVERYFNEPKAIFESQYRLFVFSDYGIERVGIYSPRNQDLEELSGVPLVVTLALETRDAISPRLRGAIAFLGSGIVYVLTEVIGRGIGLIGKGILKGIGKSVKG